MKADREKVKRKMNGKNGKGELDRVGQRNERQETENRRVTSIARRINFAAAMSLLGRYLLLDLMAVLIVSVVCCYCLDLQFLGNFEPGLHRTLFKENGVSGLVYQAGTPGSGLYYTVQIGTWINAATVGALVVGICELAEVFSQLFFGAKKIRRHLRPIQEIAVKAQELSEMALDETRYHNLENAISSLKVERPNAKIHVQDKELQGIERAVNELLDRMRSSYRQQTQFVSDASHELRTPIAVIQGYVNMLDRWGKEDEEILNESIEAIKNESAHMQKLVEQLLFLARGDSNRQKLDKKRIVLNDILREVYEESVMIDETHCYRFEECGTAQIYGDSAMIKQSARILVDNAAKYTEAGEEILIKAGLWRDGAAFYSVQDNGIGMSSEDVAHAFDRFYRADAVRNSGTGGTGLGLAIARWIVEQHDGYYDVISREEIGTRFNVIFPKPEEQNGFAM